MRGEATPKGRHLFNPPPWCEGNLTPSEKGGQILAKKKIGEQTGPASQSFVRVQRVNCGHEWQKRPQSDRKNWIRGSGREITSFYHPCQCVCRLCGSFFFLLSLSCNQTGKNHTISKQEQQVELSFNSSCNQQHQQQQQQPITS